jgi:UDP-4-amino-4,6-dideoxy-N-acetyl-beta-L-altrosamine transaminase
VPGGEVLPYGRQSIDDDDIAAVEAVLRSDWLTTGPMVPDFEATVAERVGARHGVAVSSGTAALHTAMHALGIGPGDEVIVPAMTFAATANAVVFEQGTPVFADVDPETLLLDPSDAEAKITSKTRAIVAVDYAGHPADYERLRDIVTRHDLALVSDACHALGARYRGRPVGSVADLTAFSFHPVKHVTTGEGGMVTTDDTGLAEQMYRFRNHGITTDHRAREQAGSWFYEMVDLGYNYRLTDFQSALGMSQLSKSNEWLARRRAIARRYDEAFAGTEGVTPLAVRADVEHAYHLYVVRLEVEQLLGGRADVYRVLRDEGIGVNVHYIPVHLHPYYRERFGTDRGLCPNAEQAYERILSLPIFPRMTDADVETVVQAVAGVLRRLAA